MAGWFIFNAITYIFTTSKSIGEYKIADYLMLHPETLLILFAIIAILIFLITIYKLPKHIRRITVLSAFIGFVLGCFLWYYLLGLIILP